MQAIDPRTRMVLFKMLNQGVFNDINGCISTGKEVSRTLHWFCSLFEYYVHCMCSLILLCADCRQMYIMQQQALVMS